MKRYRRQPAFEKADRARLAKGEGDLTNCCKQSDGHASLVGIIIIIIRVSTSTSSGGGGARIRSERTPATRLRCSCSERSGRGMGGPRGGSSSRSKVGIL